MVGIDEKILKPNADFEPLRLEIYIMTPRAAGNARRPYRENLSGWPRRHHRIPLAKLVEPNSRGRTGGSPVERCEAKIDVSKRTGDCDRAGVDAPQ